MQAIVKVSEKIAGFQHVRAILFVRMLISHISLNYATVVFTICSNSPEAKSTSPAQFFDLKYYLTLIYIFRRLLEYGYHLHQRARSPSLFARCSWSFFHLRSLKLLYLRKLPNQDEKLRSARDNLIYSGASVCRNRKMLKACMFLQGELRYKFNSVERKECCSEHSFRFRTFSVTVRRVNKNFRTQKIVSAAKWLCIVVCYGFHV